jgi:hypothetical protein
LEAHRSGSQADAWGKTNLKWLFVAGTSAQNAFACADYASKRQQAQLSLLVRRVVKRLRIRRELVLRGLELIALRHQVAVKFATHFALANQYTDQLPHAVRSAVIGNAGSLVVFRVGSRDAELLAPEFRPMDGGALADQEPFIAWLRRGTGRDRIFAEPKLYEPLGTEEAIRAQSRQRFGRPRRAIEKRNS